MSIPRRPPHAMINHPINTGHLSLRFENTQLLFGYVHYRIGFIVGGNWIC